MGNEFHLRPATSEPGVSVGTTPRAAHLRGSARDTFSMHSSTSPAPLLRFAFQQSSQKIAIGIAVHIALAHDHEFERADDVQALIARAGGHENFRCIRVDFDLDHARPSRARRLRAGFVGVVWQPERQPIHRVHGASLETTFQTHGIDEWFVVQLPAEADELAEFCPLARGEKRA